MPYKDPTSPQAVERMRAARRKHYLANKAQYTASNTRTREQMRQHIRGAKDRPCADCGNVYPPHVMDFDHMDPAIKIDAVSRLVNCGSWPKLMAEISKCEIVCSNCHRARTFARGGYQ